MNGKIHRDRHYAVETRTACMRRHKLKSRHGKLKVGAELHARKQPLPSRPQYAVTASLTASHSGSLLLEMPTYR